MKWPIGFVQPALPSFFIGIGDLATNSERRSSWLGAQPGRKFTKCNNKKYKINTIKTNGCMRCPVSATRTLTLRCFGTLADKKRQTVNMEIERVTKGKMRLFGFFFALVVGFTHAASDLSAGIVIDEDQNYQIYFQPADQGRFLDSNGEAPRIWYWYLDGKDNDLGVWPGDGYLTPVEDQEGWFTIKINTTREIEGFLFTDGGALQTENLQFSGSGCYVEKLTQWFPLGSAYCPFDVEQEPDSEWRSPERLNKLAKMDSLSIYFKPSNKDFNIPVIWYWDIEKETPLGNWPNGPLMKLVPSYDGWFQYKLDFNTMENPFGGLLIFNGNNLKEKSPDLYPDEDGCFVMTSATKGEWYPLGQAPCIFNPPKAAVSASRASGEFVENRVTVTLYTASGEGYYTLDGSDPLSSSTAERYSDAEHLKVGENLPVGRSVTLRIASRDSRGVVDSKSYVYKKVARDYTSRDNKTILQGFYWYVKDPIVHMDRHDYSKQPEPESNLWEYIAAEKAEQIYKDGFTHVWLPPMSKGFSFAGYNSGYAVYDRYDLGEFYQMGRVRTKYGFRHHLEDAVDALHKRKISVIADVVMNHMMGSDDPMTKEIAIGYKTDNAKIKAADPVNYDIHINYNRVTETIPAGTEVTTHLNFDFMNEWDAKGAQQDFDVKGTKYSVAGPRGTTYSDFVWTPDFFDGQENHGVYYHFKGKELDSVNMFGDMPSGSSSWYEAIRSDIVMGADIDLQHPKVQDELISWSKWLIDEIGFDGFRVDAVRHMDHEFLKRWAWESRSHLRDTGRSDALIFGENWDGYAERLDAYLKGQGGALRYEDGMSPYNYRGLDNAMSLFDVPLHFDFQKIAGENSEFLDISQLPDRGLLAKAPNQAVTFVDNHDTVPTEMLHSYIPLHTKYQAYTYILLNTRGTPCVFYRDLYKGNALPRNRQQPYVNTNSDEMYHNISRLVKLRNEYAYGDMNYYRGYQILGARLGGRNYNGGLVYLIKNNNGPTNSLYIPDDGKKWTLVAGHGDKHSFRLTGNWAVWILDSEAQKLK
jgi:alpha-amylase